MNEELLSLIDAAVLACKGVLHGQEVTFICPAHDDHHPSARWNRAKATWYCDACGQGGGALDLAKHLGIQMSRTQDASPLSRRRLLSTTRFDIKDNYDQVLAVHVRKDYSEGKKEMFWERADGTKGLGGLKVESLPLYGSEDLTAMADGGQVVVCEGEKTRDALNKRGVRAVATVTGAGTIPVDDRLRLLRRLDVLLWPDNDTPGERHMMRIAERLTLIGKTPRIVRWTEGPKGGDAADFPGDEAELWALLARSDPYRPAEIATPLPQAELAAWLDEVVRFIRRYVVLSDDQLRAIALWIAHTYVFPSFDTTPYLIITSAEKRSGKTRLLEVISYLARLPWMTGRVTGALLARRIGRDAPTLLLDENDAAFHGPKEYVEVLRQVLNVGHRRTGVASILLPAGRSGWDYEDLSLFCPKALAGIGTLPDTVLDRGIRIKLRRRSQNEKVERFRDRYVVPIAKPIREALERWAPLAGERLRDVEPVLPEELDDRAQDGWESLLAIADAAGGEWPIRARAAAIALSSGESREDESLGVRLLSDVRQVLNAANGGRLFSAQLAAELCALEEASWATLRYGALDATRIAHLLKPYEIAPKQIRIGNTTRKGYVREAFEEAWQRYLVLPGRAETGETAETNGSFESEERAENVSPEAGVSASEGKQQPLGETEIAPQSYLGAAEVSAVSPVSRSGDSDAPSDGRSHADGAIKLAAELGFPAVALGAGITVNAGQAAWEMFTSRAQPDRLQQAVLALEMLPNA